MSITDLYEKLGAPLVNSRWSWGGIDAENKRVFLRAWQDQTKTSEGRGRIVRLAHHYRYASATDNAGYNERIKHLDLLDSGYGGYVVMCKAVDPKAKPRQIASFDTRDVFRLGALIEMEDDVWGEIVERVPVRSFR